MIEKDKAKKDVIVKTSRILDEKNWAPAMGVRDIAKEKLGDLKISESFLYLYLRFGAPTYDTKDEYKISYDYLLKYKGLVFSICGTTPEFVYLDCYIPRKYYLLNEKRFNNDVRHVFEKAYKEDVLCYPWACSFSQIRDCLSEKQQRRYDERLLAEVENMLSEKEREYLNSFDGKKKAEVSIEDQYRISNMLQPVWQRLSDNFREWAREDDGIKSLFYTRPGLRYLPEVKEILEEFCNELLKPVHVRDCDINIQGWLL